MARRSDSRHGRATRETERPARARTPRRARDAAEETDAELQRELVAAAEVQVSLLPDRIPHIPGYDMYPYYRSARHVGGDYYDFFPIDREQLGIVIADVSGKGIPGAMVMASTRTLLRVLGPECGSPAETLRRTNMYIAALVKRGMFVTAIFAALNVRTHEMEICSAGHNPMLVYKEHTGKCWLLNPGGIALGFDRGPIFDPSLKQSRLVLQPGDRVVMYTDGVVEAMNSRNEQYGEKRLYRFCLTHARMTSKDFVRALVRDLDEHKGDAEQHDDITIATIRLVP